MWKRGTCGRSCLLFGLGLWFALGCSAADRERDPIGEPAASAPIELGARDVAVVQRLPIVGRIALTGTLQPAIEIQLRAPLRATLAKVAVRTGDRVRRGQTLAELDGRNLASELRRVTAERAAAQAALIRDRERARAGHALWLQQVVSDRERQQRESDYRMSEFRLQSLDAEVELARSRQAEATIRSPIDGVVAESPVGAGSTVESGATLFRIVDLCAMEWVATVRGADLSAIRVGQRATLRIQGFGPVPFEAAVDRIAPASQLGAGVPVHLRVATEASEACEACQLRAGLFAQGALTVQKIESAPSLPASAIHEEFGSPVVYVLFDGKLQRHPVELIENDGSDSRVWLRTPIDPGVLVVTDRVAGLKDGASARLARRLRSSAFSATAGSRPESL